MDDQRGRKETDEPMNPTLKGLLLQFDSLCARISQVLRMNESARAKRAKANPRANRQSGKPNGKKRKAA